MMRPNPRHGRLLASLLTAAFGLAATQGCVALGTSDNDPSARTTLTNPPPTGADFKPVGLFLVHRCGSLDCHGEIGRNLRIYGKEGLRLDPSNIPGGALTTADELDADWQSVVGLEPELMNEVVAGGGMSPALLTFYRKPTGIEHHKGGVLIASGDDQDNCILSWLAGSVDKTACAAAIDPAKYP